MTDSSPSPDELMEQYAGAHAAVDKGWLGTCTTLMEELAIRKYTSNNPLKADLL